MHQAPRLDLPQIEDTQAPSPTASQRHPCLQRAPVHRAASIRLHGIFFLATTSRWMRKVVGRERDVEQGLQERGGGRCGKECKKLEREREKQSGEGLKASCLPARRGKKWVE
ncbi:Os12g0261701 [Oryza sativa Japonica Group]|uniref:Os12g0261701 protein n=1 Tax=Oryza sativa subsp. japonica TaxID=39947 RepID=A0A0P0Y8Q7_ORYSJ|nr:Os12g0261701 [Oryza sativa Japonica Group]